MKELIVITYKAPANDWVKRMYGEDTEYIYDSVAFQSAEMAELEIKKIRRKYTEVDSFVCSLEEYDSWLDDDTSYEEFVKTGKCPLKPISEDVDVGTDSKTVTIECEVRLSREDDSSSFDYKVDIDDVGQIVFTPYDVGTRFCHEGEQLDSSDNVKLEKVRLTAQMVSESGNYDYFTGTDDVGQFVITPDVEDTSFLTASVEDSLNLVTEKVNLDTEDEDGNIENVHVENVSCECFGSSGMKVLKESNNYRDFDWTDDLYAVIKNDGTYAGVPCRSYSEAKELSYHPGSKIFKLVLDDDPTEETLEESLSDVDRMSIVDKVMRGEISVFSSEGEPDPKYIHIPELTNNQGKVTFEYYYDEESGEVVSYSKPNMES